MSSSYRRTSGAVEESSDDSFGLTDNGRLLLRCIWQRRKVSKGVIRGEAGVGEGVEKRSGRSRFSIFGVEAVM